MAPKERTYAWDAWFDAPPARVWPYVADTDRVDRLAGLPPATYVPVEAGYDVRQTFHGLLPTAYEEAPYEWVEGERFAVVRTFSKGPVTRLVVRTRLVAEERGTRVVTELDATPRSALSAFVLPLLMRSARRGHRAAHARLQLELLGEAEAPPERRAVVRKVAARLATVGPVPDDLAAHLASFVAGADAADLVRIRPFALADRWKAPRREVLATFLEAVRAGVLELTWESLCPHCRGTPRSVRRLADVRATARCEACAVDFEVEFDRSLEAVFRPAADLRRIGAQTWCLGGPGATPHVVAQRRVPAGATVEVTATLAAGAHRVRVARRPGLASLEVDRAPGGAADVEVTLGDGEVRATPAAVGAGPVRLRVTNTTAREATFVLERTAWLDDVATALDVVALPGFADVFTADVLAPGERVAVRRVAFLFTDLKGSTALYRRVGDAAAYARVRDVFHALRDAVRAHDGMLVKTIGDAVMAAFPTPASACAAAFAMHRAVACLAVPAGEPPLVLKAGLHVGRSLVVNAGGALDFFGTTTNLAARAQHEARGGDVVLTDAAADDEGVRRVLAGVPHDEERFAATLKGFTAPVGLRRLVPR